MFEKSHSWDDLGGGGRGRSSGTILGGETAGMRVGAFGGYGENSGSALISGAMYLNRGKRVEERAERCTGRIWKVRNLRGRGDGRGRGA